MDFRHVRRNDNRVPRPTKQRNRQLDVSRMHLGFRDSSLMSDRCTHKYEAIADMSLRPTENKAITSPISRNFVGLMPSTCPSCHIAWLSPMPRNSVVLSHKGESRHHDSCSAGVIGNLSGGGGPRARGFRRIQPPAIQRCRIATSSLRQVLCHQYSATRSQRARCAIRRTVR